MIGKDPRPGEEHIRRTNEYVKVLLPAIREVGEQCGYAIGVHGSLERDIDLIGCPWRDSCVDAEYLAKRIFDVCNAIYGAVKWSGGWTEQSKDEEFKPPPGSLPNPSRMPCGRLAWTIILSVHSNHYIDLSVMPIGTKQ